MRLLVRTLTIPPRLRPKHQGPSALGSKMAAPEPEAKLEAVTPSRSHELPPESESDAPASTGSQELKPWEQHAAVINLPRYDYRASGSLLLRSHSGFLITCPISAFPFQLYGLFPDRNLCCWIDSWIHVL